MKVLGDGSSPPTSRRWAKYIGGADPAKYRLYAMGLHVAPGLGAGAVFVIALGALGVSPDRQVAMDSLLFHLVCGVVFVWLGGRRRAGRPRRGGPGGEALTTG